MKRLSTKILSLTIMLMILMTTFVNATTLSIDTKYTTAQKEVVSLLNQLHSTKEIKNTIPLHDFNGKENSVLFIFKDTGYAIVSLVDNTVCEFSLQNNNKYMSDKNSYYVYNGPLDYYKKSNNKVIDLKTNTEVKNLSTIKDKLRSAAQKSVNNDKKTSTSSSVSASATTSASATYTYTLSLLKSTLPNYAYNPNGVCGSCAAAMYLRYWSNNIDARYVPSNLRTNDGVALTKTLIPYNEGQASLDPKFNSPGTNVTQLSSGIQKYLRTRGISYSMHYEVTNFSRIAERVKYNRPFIVGLEGHPRYGSHWTTGYGYITRVNGLVKQLAYIVVNDGWGNQGVFINANYSDVIVW